MKSECLGLLDTLWGYLYEMNIYPLGVFVKRILKVYDFEE